MGFADLKLMSPFAAFFIMSTLFTLNAFAGEPQLPKNHKMIRQYAQSACGTSRCDMKGDRRITEAEADKIMQCFVTEDIAKALNDFGAQGRRFSVGASGGLMYKCTINSGFSCTRNFLYAAVNLKRLREETEFLILTPKNIPIDGYGAYARHGFVAPEVTTPFDVNLRAHGTVTFDGLKSKINCFSSRPDIFCQDISLPLVEIETLDRGSRDDTKKCGEIPLS